MNRSNAKCHAIIMAGGQGTRFWPESTSRRPKQYLNLLGPDTLLTETLKRFDGLVDTKDRFIVTVKEQEKLAKECSKSLIGDGGLIFEPSGRNTAPCILLAMAALQSMDRSGDDLVAIVPSDHVILNREGFQSTLKKAYALAAEKEAIVTIGINPTFPHTGFGYIQRGEAAGAGHKVVQFKEKPNKETAEAYLGTGDYYWNAGMFVAPIKVLLEEFAAHSAETYKSYAGLRDHYQDFNKVSEIYRAIPSDSIDYAVMEKSSRVYVIAAEFDWNDLGSWDALEAVIDKKDDNILVQCNDTYFEEAKGNIIYAPDKFVSLIGVNDLIVVSNDDVVMVLPKDQSQKVKNIVSALKKDPRGKELL